MSRDQHDTAEGRSPSADGARAEPPESAATEPRAFRPGDEADPAAPLGAYRVAKERVTAILRSVHRALAGRSPDDGERAHELLARLAEDAFELVVVGQFTRGKTSLMNAIVGRPLLPTGALPVTTVVTSLRYGAVDRAFAIRAGGLWRDPVAIEDLPSFVTERGNPGNEKHVASVEIETPARFLRRGLHFVDTPGIGSANERNTLTTLECLPSADAAIFVTAADGPLSESEVAFLDAVRAHVRKLFFVINKIDLAAPAERPAVVSYAADLLARRLGVERVPVFAVSAIEALQAARDRPEARETSGLAALEAALAAFLDRERRQTRLVALVDRAARLVEAARRAEHASEDRDEPAATLNTLLDRIITARRALSDGHDPPEYPPDAVPLPAAQVGSKPQPSEGRPPVGTCMACAAVTRAVFDFLCVFQYDVGHDPATMQRFLIARGLCASHTWQLESIASTRGLCAAYPPLLDRTADRVRGVAGLTSEGLRERLRDLRPDEGACPACAVRRRAERMVLERVAPRIAEPAWRAEFERSQWLCLPHLERLARVVDEASAAWLLRIHADRLRQMAESMREYALKHDARRRDLVTDDEARAYRQGLVALVGERGR